MLDTDRLIIGQFKPGDGFTYRLDPRTKIILVFIIMVLVLLIIDIWFYLGLVAILLAWLFSCRLSPWKIINNLKPVFWFVLFTALFHLVFSGHDDPHKLLTLGSFSISFKAVELAEVYSARIVIFILATFIVSLTTSPLALSEGIISLIKPLRWIKVPIYDLGMILFIALRFIPVLTGEFEMIRKSQLIRGVTFSGGWLQRIKKSIALLLPVFFSAIRRADELSIAIETRGYKSGQPRSSLNPPKYTAADIILLSVIAVGIVSYVITDRWYLR